MKFEGYDIAIKESACAMHDQNASQKDMLAGYDGLDIWIGLEHNFKRMA